MELKYNKPYVYQHKIGDEVIYIGAGKNARYSVTSQRTATWHKMVSEAGGFTPVIVKYFDSTEEALAFEKAEIKRLKPRGNFTHNNVGNPKVGKPQKKKDIATTNIRIYPSTLVALHSLAENEGKSISRLVDEKFNPHKYQVKQ